MPRIARPADDDPQMALRLSGIRKSYGTTAALNGVDLAIAAGDVLGLVGANGAGKTTLISIAAGLLHPDSGDASVFGEPAGRRRHDVGIAPQALGIYPTVRVRDNLVLFGELAGVRGRELELRVAEVAEVMRLTGLLGRRAGSLSGGEQRRLHVAMALVHRPRLLLLDEPSASLDVESALALLEVVKSLAAAGTAVCYSTNHLTEVELLGRSVAIMDAGQVIVHGTLATVLERHAAPAPPRPAERRSLQSAFLAVTGRPYSADGSAAADLRHAHA